MVDGLGLRRKPNAVVRLGRFRTKQFSKPNALGMTLFPIILLIGNYTIKTSVHCVTLAQQPYLLFARPFLKITPARRFAPLLHTALDCLSYLPGAARSCPLPVSARGRCLPAASCNRHRRPAAYKRRRVAASGKLHTPTSLHSPKQQGDVAMC